MKTRQIIIAVLSLLYMSLSAQTSGPLIIEGQIINSTEPRLYIPVQLGYGLFHIDTIPLDENGRFHYMTDKVAFPQKANLRNQDTQLNDFFIAPGYHLTITGDGPDFFTLLKTAKIEGAESNRYKMLHDADGMVARAYEANAIPRYILIDKNGNIADINAPSPGNKEVLENKFSEEMSK